MHTTMKMIPLNELYTMKQLFNLPYRKDDAPHHTDCRQWTDVRKNENGEWFAVEGLARVYYSAEEVHQHPIFEHNQYVRTGTKPVRVEVVVTRGDIENHLRGLDKFAA